MAGVDISGMIGELPGGRDTRSFSTTNASGSTSQAANIAEALEIGTSLLLVDEDTSATNFMIRDERMRALVSKEPISPFIDLVRPLRGSLGVSTVVVVGGVGDYLDVADRVILMEDYEPRDATRAGTRGAQEVPGQGAAQIWSDESTERPPGASLLYRPPARQAGDGAEQRTLHHRARPGAGGPLIPGAARRGRPDRGYRPHHRRVRRREREPRGRRVVNGALGSLRAGLDSLETSGGIPGVEFAASTGGGCGDQPHPLARSRCGSLEDLDQQNQRGRKPAR